MINYANPQGVGATVMPGAANQQRDAITQALMNAEPAAARQHAGRANGNTNRPWDRGRRRRWVLGGMPDRWRQQCRWCHAGPATR